MMTEPRGHKYWVYTDGDVFIRDDAPEWAKKEFEVFWDNTSDIPSATIVK